MLFVTQEIRAERLAICKACKHFKEATRTCGPAFIGKRIKGGRLCGCVMPVKTQFKTASCPLGHWGPSIPAEELQGMRDFLASLGTDITAEENQRLADYFTKATGLNAEPTTCSSCLRERVREIRSLLNNDPEAYALEATPKQ